MEKLIETITFCVGAIGASILIFTLFHVLSRLFIYLDKLSDKSNKTLIKEVLREKEKEGKKKE